MTVWWRIYAHCARTGVLLSVRVCVRTSVYESEQLYTPGRAVDDDRVPHGNMCVCVVWCACACVRACVRARNVIQALKYARIATRGTALDLSGRPKHNRRVGGINGANTAYPSSI